MADGLGLAVRKVINGTKETPLISDKEYGGEMERGGPVSEGGEVKYELRDVAPSNGSILTSDCLYIDTILILANLKGPNSIFIIKEEAVLHVIFH